MGEENGRAEETRAVSYDIWEWRAGSYGWIRYGVSGALGDAHFLALSGRLASGDIDAFIVRGRGASEGLPQRPRPEPKHLCFGTHHYRLYASPGVGAAGGYVAVAGLGRQWTEEEMTQAG